VLNLGFSAAADDAYGTTYVLPESLAARIAANNQEQSGGEELRTQAVYGDELWSRLSELGLAELPWRELDVLDACAGSGFLSYHLLRRAAPRQLTLLDISASEVRHAEQLIRTLDGDRVNDITFGVGDLATFQGSRSFDLVIGNSFLHHFPDVRLVLDRLFATLRPGGLLVGLHEPTPAAVPLESGDLRHVAAFVMLGDRYLRWIRHKGPDTVADGTVDVWMFKPRELGALLSECGFTDVRVVPRYVLRPFFVALLKLHLDTHHPRLSSTQARLLRATVRADAHLKRVLPGRLYGGLSFAARRPDDPAHST
jgi:SAM-dependent methyltransferase